MKENTRRNSFIALSMATGIALSGCGGGGSSLTSVPGVDEETSWSFPVGHGLMAGEIIVQPGMQERHDSVVVSCPAGGSECVVTIAADGSATYDSTGGMPTVMAVPGTSLFETEMRENDFAEDLLDHWNKSELLREKMKLTAVNGAVVGARKDSLAFIIGAAATSSTDSRAQFLNASTEDIEIIGERDGITYGQLKEGPAGTLNIDVDWQLAEDVSPEARAEFRRAAKVWARRIQDDFSPSEIKKGRQVELTGRFREFNEDAETEDGLLIAVVQDSNTGDANWLAAASFADAVFNEPDNFEPGLGIIWVNWDKKEQLQKRWAGIMSHEIGHVLGIGPTRTRSWTANINYDDHTFTGPRAVKENDGEAVPLQWLDEDYNAVAPNTEGADRDRTHLGVCNSIVSYACDVKYVLIPTELEFAVLEDLGYDILDRNTASEPELYGYGAWGRYSFWGAGVERILSYDERNEDYPRPDFTDPYFGYEFATDELYASAEAFGIPPTTTLSDSSLFPDQGIVKWKGSLIGVDLGHNALPPVSGDAELGVSMETLFGTASFDDLQVITDDQIDDFRKTNLDYDISVAGNAFADSNGIVSGGFYGPEHEEMAGTLQDTSEAVNLLAGFGGKR